MEGFTVRRTFVDGMLDDDAKSRSPVTALIRWNLWITKQAIASLQGAVRAAKDILPPLLSRLARWTSQLPRLPAQQKQLTIPLPRLPSVLPRLPSSPYFSHPLHFQQALDIIDI
jgi:hypothetical protein